jgi:hypothetical protein
MLTENNAKLLEIGEVKLSKSWTNLYLKFKFESGEERWLYYSEHIDKPIPLKQIEDFVFPQKYKIGDTMTVNYKLVQSPNKSTKLAIINVSNHKRKKLIILTIGNIQK